MKKAEPREPAARPHQRLTFESTLERIAEGMEYYALSVPQATSQAAGARAAVPVFAKVNGSEAFLGSLHPVGGGRHCLRVRNKVCKSVGLQEGDAVRVEIVVRDREEEVDVPADLKKALRAEGVLDGFEALPVGKKTFMLRMIEKAAKSETREKRIREIVEEARHRRDKARG